MTLQEQIYSNVWVNALDNVGNNVWVNIFDNVCDNVRNNVWGNIKRFAEKEIV